MSRYVTSRRTWMASSFPSRSRPIFAALVVSTTVGSSALSPALRCGVCVNVRAVASVQSYIYTRPTARRHAGTQARRHARTGGLAEHCLREGQRVGEHPHAVPGLGQLPARGMDGHRGVVWMVEPMRAVRGKASESDYVSLHQCSPQALDGGVGAEAEAEGALLVHGRHHLHLGPVRLRGHHDVSAWIAWVGLGWLGWVA